LRYRTIVLLAVIAVIAVAAIWIMTRLTAGPAVPVAEVESGAFRVSIIRTGEVKARIDSLETGRHVNVA
jgi:hypothetical protein